MQPPIQNTLQEPLLKAELARAARRHMVGRVAGSRLQLNLQVGVAAQQPLLLQGQLLQRRLDLLHTILRPSHPTGDKHTVRLVPG